MRGEAAPQSWAARGTGCPSRLPRRATLQRAWPALGRAPPAHLEFSAGRKTGEARQITPCHRDLKLERGGDGAREGWRGPLPGSRREKASAAVVHPAPFRP